MKKTVNFIVDKRNFILIAFILITVISAIFIPKVNVNSDMTKYLPDNSSTRIGIDIMADELPASNTVYVMFKGLNEDEKMAIYGELSEIQNILSVSYEEENEKYNKDGYTLYVVTADFGAYSDEAKKTVEVIREKYSEYDVVLSGETAGNTALNNLPLILIPAVIILMVILFLMCNSWVEPIIFLVNIAVAVVINMGTNAFFGSVSEITQSICAVLQLVLSMDYSIMLLNRYRQEKEVTDNKYDAMKNALGNAFISISGSSVTTIVGMLMLVFMSFTIGRDLGLVLAKGIFMSLVSIFTVLPALILMFDKAIEKTAKKSLHIKMNKIASFSYSARYAILAVFAVLFAGSFLIKGSVGITYTMNAFDEVYKVFMPDNPIVILYENRDESNIAALAEKWSENVYVESVNYYAATLGKELTYGELAEVTDMDETLVALIYNYYYDDKDEVIEKKIALGEFIRFVREDVASNEQFAAFFTADALVQLDAIGSSEQPRLSGEEFAMYTGMDVSAVQRIYGYYFSVHGNTDDGKIALDDLTQFLMTEIVTNEQFAPLFSDDVLAQLNAMNAGTDNSIMEQELSSGELAEYIGMDPAVINLLYGYYVIVHGETPQGTIALYDFMRFIINNVATREEFQPYFGDDTLLALRAAETEMEEGLNQLVGAKFSRIIINTTFSEESKEAFEFIENISKELDSALDGEHYIIGNSAMAYEMSVSFPGELNFITILTAAAIFLVVAIAFRSISVPLILVCVIQCAVFITMGTAYIQGSSILYLPLLIVQCLLMGATIDYGILYISYYIESRKSADKREAVAAALNNSIHTILTSGLILFVVTLVLGLLLANSDHAISEILLIISRGSFCAIVLVVFILPSLISVFDRFVRRKTENYRSEN